MSNPRKLSETSDMYAYLKLPGGETAGVASFRIVSGWEKKSFWSRYKETAWGRWRVLLSQSEPWVEGYDSVSLLQQEVDSGVFTYKGVEYILTWPEDAGDTHLISQLLDD